jgi:hypothetical protein
LTCQAEAWNQTSIIVVGVKTPYLGALVYKSLLVDLCKDELWANSFSQSRQTRENAGFELAVCYLVHKPRDGNESIFLEEWAISTGKEGDGLEHLA